MKRQIMFEHRAALDAYEEAKNKHVSCRRKSGCGDVSECVDCPFFQTKRAAEEVFEEKCAALKDLNKQVVQQNDALAQQQVLKRKQQRLEKRQQKQNIKATIPHVQKDVRIPKKREEKGARNEMPIADKTSKNLTRKDLTKERYLQHRDVEKLTQTQIAKMYNIPHGSITGVIKKLTAQEELNEQVVQTQENTQPIVQSDLQAQNAQLTSKLNETLKSKQRLQVEYDELHVSYNKLQKELVAVQEMNQLRKDTIAELEKELEAARNRGEAGEAPDYQALYESEKQMSEHYKLLANDYALALENYQNEVAALIHSRDVHDEEVAAALIEREQETDQYEIQLLKRILQLKQQ